MFKRILVAIDASEYSKQILPAAKELAAKFQSDVFVLHVAEHSRGRAAAYETETPADATRLVADAVKVLREAGVNASGEIHDVAVGHAAKDIVETAASAGSDVIVMGSRGLSDMQGILLGSVTHKVMQLTHVAVLVVRNVVPAKVEEPAAVKTAVAV